MNVNLNNPITITLQSAFLVQESDGLGTLQFRILDQPVSLVFSTSEYTYDTPFNIGDRVSLIDAHGYFGVGSEGIIQNIIIDSTDDKADVFFDKVIPDQQFVTDQDLTKVSNTQISLQFRVSLSNLQIV